MTRPVGYATDNHEQADESVRRLMRQNEKRRDYIIDLIDQQGRLKYELKRLERLFEDSYRQADKPDAVRAIAWRAIPNRLRRKGLT